MVSGFRHGRVGNKIKKLKVWRELERVICVNSPRGLRTGRERLSRYVIGGTCTYNGGEKKTSPVLRMLMHAYLISATAANKNLQINLT